MPVDPRYLLAALAAGLIAAAVLTSGFGLFGDGDGGRGGSGAKGDRNDKPEKIEVAVLNATQTESEVTGEVIAGIPMLADKVADEVVKPAGYAVGEQANAASGVDETVIMFDSSNDGDDAAANEREAASLPRPSPTGSVRPRRRRWCRRCATSPAARRWRS